MAAVDGPALKLLRERTGWSAKDFAEANDITASYLADIENGHRNLKRSPALRKKLAGTLQAPVSMIERRTEPEAVQS